jgi:hypothetical protein
MRKSCVARTQRAQGGSAAIVCCASTTHSIFHAGLKSRAQIRPEAWGTLPFAHGFGGELHGRKLDPVLMWGRVHNRTSDRGGKPIRLVVAVGAAPGPPEDRGPFACTARSPCRALCYREPIAATSS